MVSMNTPLFLSLELLSTLVLVSAQNPQHATNFRAIQSGINRVNVSWTRPRATNPLDGYTIYIGPNRPIFTTGINVHQNTKFHILDLRPGHHRIWLIIRFRGFFSYPSVGPAIAIVRDFRVAVNRRNSLLTATSVTIHWTNPRFTQSTDMMQIEITRLTMSRLQFCPTLGHHISNSVAAESGRAEITGLHEFSSYFVRMTFIIPSGYETVRDYHTLVTLSAAPTGAPERIVYYASFQTIRAYWSEIPCSDHNGQITNYVYQLRQVGGALVPDDQLQVVDMNFTATGLTPNTNYILRVAGININGTGPFATVRILTRNDKLIPTNFTAEQVDKYTILLTWATIIPPTRYLVTTGNSRPTRFDSGTLLHPRTKIIRLNLGPGIHLVWLVALQADNDHIVVGPVSVALRDFRTPLNLMFSSLNSTSISMSWTRPRFSLSTDVYWAELSRLVGDERQLCPMVEDYKLKRTTSISAEFTDLHAFSIYKVNLTIVVPDGIYFTLTDDTAEFTTMILAPTAPPPNITYSFSSRSINASWTEIECLERKGPITDYVVELREVGGDLRDLIPGIVVDRTFTARGLTPYTNYTLRVAGMNNEHIGPFSDINSFSTLEDTPGRVSGLVSVPRFTFIILTWRPPEEPNGVIISYEVTYTVNGGNTFRVNTSNSTFTIPSLTPQTSLSPLAVTAYTKIGRGEPTFINESTLDVPSMVLNVEVIALSYSSVNVSWDRINNPLIISYTIYYSINKTEEEETDPVTVPSSVNSVVIGNLSIIPNYFFQVAAIAEIDGDIAMGKLSEVIVPLPFIPIGISIPLEHILSGILGFSILSIIGMAIGFWVKSKYFTKLPVFENLMEMNDEIESSTSSISNELDEAPPRHSFKRELASLSSPSSSMSTIRDVQVLYA